MSNAHNDVLYETLESLGGIWYKDTETIDEAIERTRSRFGSWRRSFAALMGYTTTDGVTYTK